MARQKRNERAAVRRKGTESKSPVICVNKDCKLRKQKNCKGFEGCPGYHGR